MGVKPNIVHKSPVPATVPSSAPVTRSKGHSTSNADKPLDQSTQHAESGDNASKTPAKKKAKCGLKIIHHGIVKQPIAKQGKRCTYEMCGEKFKDSTSFIMHYSTTHPPLPYKYCLKVYAR